MTPTERKAHLMEDEIWKDVPGYGGGYQASSLGRIKSKARTRVSRVRGGHMATQHYKERILSTKANPNGYVYVHLGFGGKKQGVFAHKLVLLAFVGPCPEGMECCHSNGVSSDNRIENLRWDTHLNNNRDRVLHGTYPTGEAHPMAKYTDEQVSIIHQGKIKKSEAIKQFGISCTHFYRIKNEGRIPTNGN